jgi:hypothetical protein
LEIRRGVLGEFSGVPIAIVFILGNRVDAVWADVDRDVSLFKSLWLP